MGPHGCRGCTSNSGMNVAHCGHNGGTNSHAPPYCGAPSSHSPGHGTVHSPCNYGHRCWIPPPQSLCSGGSPSQTGQSFSPPCHWVPSFNTNRCCGSQSFRFPCSAGHSAWGWDPNCYQPCRRVPQSYSFTGGPINPCFSPHCNTPPCCIVICIPVRSCHKADKSTSCPSEECADRSPDQATTPCCEHATCCALKESQQPHNTPIGSASLPMQGQINEEDLQAKEDTVAVPYFCQACCEAVRNIQCMLPHHYGHVRRIIVCIPNHMVENTSSCTEESMDHSPTHGSVPDPEPTTSCAVEQPHCASPQPYGKSNQPCATHPRESRAKEEPLEANEENLEAKGKFEPAN